jgi:hypothetical protein
MTFRWWERWGILLGILAVALWVIAFAVSGSTPSTDDSNSEISSWFASNSHQRSQLVGFFVFLAGTLAFLGFLGALRSRLAVAEGAPGPLAALAYGAGVASMVLWVGALACFVAPAAVVNDTRASYLDPNSYRLISNLGYLFWVGAVVAGAIVVWATSAVALRTAILPRWFAWLGVLVGVLLLFAIFFIPAFIYWGWIVVAAGLLAWRRPVAELPPATRG